MSQSVSGAFAEESQGPNASLQFGQVAQNQAMADSLKSTNPQAYAAAQTPDFTNMQNSAQNTGSSHSMGINLQVNAVQPQQAPQWSAADAFPDLSEGQGNWRERLNTWAAPEYPYLSFFARLANVGSGNPQNANK